MGLHFENDDGATASAAFKTVATPSGSSPVAITSTDVLTLTSTGGTLQITGTAATRTVDFAVTGVTSAELGYLSGVTSSIQTQLNAKAPSASPTFTGTITTPLTASRVVVTGASNELAASATTATEVGYLSGSTGVTGTGSIVRATSPTLVTPDLGVATATSINGTSIPSSATLTKTSDNLSVFAATTSAQLAGVISDETGSGALVFATSPTLVTPTLGVATATSINGTSIPSSATLTKTSDNLSVFAATTSAQLAGVISDETGSGSLVFATSPTLVTPTLGVATATSINGTSIPSSATLTKTSDNLSVFAATTSAQLAGVISDETGSGSLVFATSPTLVTPTLGVATATSLAMGESLDASSILDVASTSKGFLEPRMTGAQRDAISSPATGLQVYNTTTNKLNYYNGTAWTEVGSGTSMGVNYIPEADGSYIGDWVTYADAAGTSPVDGTGGSPGATFAISTNSSMRGSSNFLFTHDAADRQGNGFSITKSIDPSDRGRVLRLSFDYLVASGTYADNDLTIWFYDVTNSALLQGAPYQIKNSSLIERFYSEVQVPSSCASLRVIFHVSTTTATAYTMRFDDFNFSNQAKLYGSPVTDGVSFTPTGSWTTNTTYTGVRRRVGDVEEFDIKIDLAGAPDAAALSVNLPITIDTTKISSTLAGVKILGIASMYDSSPDEKYNAFIVYNSTTSIAVRADDGDRTNSTVSNTNPITFASGDSIHLRFSVPVLGRSSSVVMSNDADTRVVALAVTGDPASATAGNPIIFPTVTYDTHGGYNASTGRYTVPSPGYYRVHGYTNGDAAAITMKIYKNAVAQVNLGVTMPTYLATTMSGTVSCIAGDILDIRPDGTYDAASTSFMFIEKIQGPAQIAASETVAARYYASATSISGSLATISWTTKDYDTHGGMSSGTYTCPISGKYLVQSAIALTGTFALNNTTIIEIQKNGVAVSNLTRYIAAAVTNDGVDIEDTINCLAGDTLRIQVSNSGTTPSIVSSNTRNYMTIARIGNY